MQTWSCLAQELTMNVQLAPGGAPNDKLQLPESQRLMQSCSSSRISKNAGSAYVAL